MPIKPSSAKAKGRALQQRVRDAILDTFPDLSEYDVVSCPMGSNGADIQLSQAARERFPFSVECKARKSVALLYEALHQAERLDGLTPMVVMKADRKRPLVVLDFETFMALVQPD